MTKKLLGFQSKIKFTTWKWTLVWNISEETVALKVSVKTPTW